MELKSGFKLSEVGAIPEDWEVMSLGSLVTSVEYGSSAKARADGSTPVLRMGNLQDGKIDWDDLVYTDDAGEIAKYSLRDGDVLFNRTNTIDLVGKTSIYQGNRPAIFAGYLIRVKPDRERLDARYLNYVLNAEYSRKHSLKVLSVAVGQANINGRKLRTYLIPLPLSKSEQESIATAIADVDELLNALDTLIAKKRNLKQAAMRQLLSGEIRLPGFGDRWEARPLGTVLRLQVGFPFSSSFFSDDRQGIRLIKNRDLKADDQVFHYTGPFDQSYMVQNNDVLVGMDGDFLPCLWQKGDALLNQRVGRVMPVSGLDLTYAYYRLMNPLKEIEAKTSSTTVKHLSHRDVEDILVLLPNPTEQSAIGQALLDMDAELAALEARRDKTRLLKLGMMQELLTGKTRLAPHA